MQLIRGTTPTITANIKGDIDLSHVFEVWMYIYQGGSIKIDKDITDVSKIDAEKSQIIFRLSQQDTLGLIAGNALIQIRLLMNDGIALASVASNVNIAEVYKGGVIGG